MDEAYKLKIVIEYRVGLVDRHGDIYDWLESFEGRGSKARAVKWFDENAVGLVDGEECRAVLLERAKQWWNDFEGLRRSEEESVKWIGDETAVRAGGWID